TRVKQYRARALSASHFSKLFFSAKNPEAQPLQLYAALKHLNRNDRSFDTGFELDGYLQAATETAAQGGFDVVVYGHTHLPKKKRLPLPDSRWYMNTGTWCDVIKLPDAVTGGYEQAEVALREFAAALRNNDYRRYLRRYLSFVEIVVDPTGAQRVGEPQLYSYCGPLRERSSPLTDTLGIKEAPHAADNS
ncbi:MAG TPA: hypothetical protein VE842_07335, partial [Pyrinomonadaceae bacterium]|nr:hypothetical protein [Pyrinomonadaceae bacterium]